jgi:hypothetical protein
MILWPSKKGLEVQDCCMEYCANFIFNHGSKEIKILWSSDLVRKGTTWVLWLSDFDIQTLKIYFYCKKNIVIVFGNKVEFEWY